MPQERILIVEDEPDLRQVFVDILTSEGLDYQCRGQGKTDTELSSFR